MYLVRLPVIMKIVIKNTLFPGEVQHQTKGLQYDGNCLRMDFKSGHEH